MRGMGYEGFDCIRFAELKEATSNDSLNLNEGFINKEKELMP